MITAKVPDINWHHTGAILTGGRSSRMGKDKAGIMLRDGRTMIEYVYDALASVCRQVVLAGHSMGLPDRMKDITIVQDRWKDSGPLAGMEALLSTGMDNEYLVAACDLPFINTELLKLLLSDTVSPPVIFKPVGDAHAVPLVLRITVQEYDEVLKALTSRRLRINDLMLALHPSIITVPPELSSCLKNVNTPEELNTINRAG